MGDSCISELDLSYHTSEDPYQAPRPLPDRFPLSVPDRCMVALRRPVSAPQVVARKDAMDIEGETETGAGNGPFPTTCAKCISSDVGFGFPAPTPITSSRAIAKDALPRSLPHRATLAKHNSTWRQPRSRRGTTSASSAHYSQGPPHPRRLPAAASTPEVFQSISATPGLRELSFEELRVECYAISALTTGKAPQPVAPSSGSMQPPRVERLPSVKVMPPAFAPFIASSADTKEAQDGGEMPVGREVVMSQDALSADFTFTASVVA
ncbi:hypothetical protein C2E23DRAFT_882665 [Lenzites betulinus]|nr:hypothetical protein C2E23DRAFT_882665 [Lenzites betulinus]